mmetsp:Transcript_42406/g.83231  ORF Transcript_42406/g.83231 Transcript_42406/m.83231 type:complete len:254 (+) Transcript_42406:412-1173(+)
MKKQKWLTVCVFFLLFLLFLFFHHRGGRVARGQHRLGNDLVELVFFAGNHFQQLRSLGALDHGPARNAVVVDLHPVASLVASKDDGAAWEDTDTLAVAGWLTSDSQALFAHTLVLDGADHITVLLWIPTHNRGRPSSLRPAAVLVGKLQVHGGGGGPLDLPLLELHQRRPRLVLAVPNNYHNCKKRRHSEANRNENSLVQLLWINHFAFVAVLNKSEVGLLARAGFLGRQARPVSPGGVLTVEVRYRVDCCVD